MKKLFYFAFAALLCCGMSACSDDDEVGSLSDLLGSWTLLKEVYIENGVEDVDAEYAYGECVWTFNEDGSYVVVEDGYTVRATYQMSGNSLKVSEDGYTMAVQILQLTASDLVLQFNDKGELGRLYFRRYE